MQIMLMADYECFPLWCSIDGGVSENIDPASLAISIGLQQQIDTWDEQYQATYVADNPVVSGFSDATVKASFVEQGYQLIQALQREFLSQGLNEVDCVYFDISSNTRQAIDSQQSRINRT